MDNYGNIYVSVTAGRPFEFRATVDVDKNGDYYFFPDITADKTIRICFGECEWKWNEKKLKNRCVRKGDELVDIYLKKVRVTDYETKLPAASGKTLKVIVKDFEVYD